MITGARRLLSRVPHPSARRALLMLCLWLAGPVAASGITDAVYTGPTSDYPHGVLGDSIEWQTLEVSSVTTDGRTLSHVITAPTGRVFEDIAPRLWDITGDGAPEVVTVESDAALGARLVIYGLQGAELKELAATPNIGTRFRWLAPVGAADLDGDGHIEIAFVDRPHLAKTLRIWRWQDGAFQQVAAIAGYSNHRIGEDFISGGLRDCGAGPEMVLATANWSGLVALRWDGDGFMSDPMEHGTAPNAFENALSCR
ncbi:VCBS repeat-containing protein [uncultured Roseobacter sp.]|uniref:FG-GAP repeat domain-containing protein n=1 Tax=uncultured Roseobacter sp. TaxID=114847 RepID=UPI00262B3999|nr:VCBS repeat-containing protein [uncultured Roseobacter sp.]